MKSIPLILFLLISIPSLRSQDLPLPKTPEERQTLIQSTFQKREWKKSSDLISKSLANHLTQGKAPDPTWSENFGLAQTFNQIQKLYEKQPQWITQNEKSIQEILEYDTLPQILGSSLTPEDSLEGAWKILVTMHEKAFADIVQYPTLAVAIALVHDVPFTPWWPHPQVSPFQVPISPHSEIALLQYFSRQARRGALQVNLNKLTIQELKFMVDLPLQISELEWANSNVKTSRSEFHKVFSSIPYNNKRILQGQFRWPSDFPYTLANIQKETGICVDQAYFAWIAGKAKGIPTLYFTGQGKDGGHAWFGFLKTDDRWEMNAGRYENQNYVTGYAYNPQTWKEMTDHDLDLLTNRTSSEPSYQKSLQIVQFTQLHSNLFTDQTRISTLLLATQLAPQNRESWIVLLKQTANDRTSPEARSITQRVQQYFPNDSEIRSLLFTSTPSLLGSPANDLQSVLTNPAFQQRSDLALQAAWKVLESEVDQNKIQESQRDFSTILRRYASTGGPLFHTIVRPYILKLQEKKHLNAMRDAFRSSRSALNPAPQSITDLEFQSLGAQIRIAQP